RVLPAWRMLCPGLESAHDRRAARCLYRYHARPLGTDEANRLELRERLPHADQPGPAAGRIKDHVGNVPAELLRELEAHGLLAFDPVGLLQRRGVEPADLAHTIGNDLAAII